MRRPTMNRCLAFLFAICCAVLSVSSACIAQPIEWLHFTLAPSQEAGAVRADFRGEIDGQKHDNWSSSFRTADLVGLDLAGFRAAGSRPLRFAIVREAGRLDCTGQGGASYAAGNCAATSDAGFL